MLGFHLVQLPMVVSTADRKRAVQSAPYQAPFTCWCYMHHYKTFVSLEASMSSRHRTLTDLRATKRAISSQCASKERQSSNLILWIGTPEHLWVGAPNHWLQGNRRSLCHSIPDFSARARCSSTVCLGSCHGVFYFTVHFELSSEILCCLC